MKSYKKPIYTSVLKHANVTKGESLEMKMERIINNKEPIKDGAPIVYTERKEGVRPSHNIRTDRYEIAVQATDKISKSYKARREESATKREKGEGGAQSTHGKDETSTDKNQPK